MAGMVHEEGVAAVDYRAIPVHSGVVISPAYIILQSRGRIQFLLQRGTVMSGGRVPGYR